jgi:hypothetical protein
MKLLTQNGKMRKSGGDKYVVFNWGIVANQTQVNGKPFKTCPWAGKCAKDNGCYALQPPYNWKNVSPAFQAKLELSLQPEFVDLMSAEITKIAKRKSLAGKTLVIRIHDSGDFYNTKYLSKWIEIMERFSEVEFYAYTKAVQMMWFWDVDGKLPLNFTWIASEGGTQDHMIEPRMRHSRVFESTEALEAAGYDNAMDDDTVAFTSKTGKIGLVYHGSNAKKWRTSA